MAKVGFCDYIFFFKDVIESVVNPTFVVQFIFMTPQEQFLTEILFADLDYEVKGEGIYVFKALDFKELIVRCGNNGVGAYKMLVWKDDEVLRITTHDDFNKKATDVRWLKTAFYKFFYEDKTCNFSAEFKISEKLLERKEMFVPKVKDEEEE